MTEHPQQVSVSEMIRTTAGNTNNLMLQIADHIDKLENHIRDLEKRIIEMENKENESN